MILFRTVKALDICWNEPFRLVISVEGATMIIIIITDGIPEELVYRP